MSVGLKHHTYKGYDDIVKSTAEISIHDFVNIKNKGRWKKLTDDVDAREVIIQTENETIQIALFRNRKGH